MFDLTTYVKKWRIRQLKTVFSTLDTLWSTNHCGSLLTWYTASPSHYAQLSQLDLVCMVYVYNSHVEYERWLRVRESIMWQDWTTNQPNSPPTNVPFLEELLWLWIHLYITALKSYSVLCILNTLYCWRTTFHHPPILVHQKANLLKITESPKLNWIQIPNLLEERLYRCWFHLTGNHESR